MKVINFCSFINWLKLNSKWFIDFCSFDWPNFWWVNLANALVVVNLTIFWKLILISATLKHQSHEQSVFNAIFIIILQSFIIEHSPSNFNLELFYFTENLRTQTYLSIWFYLLAFVCVSVCFICIANLAAHWICSAYVDVMQTLKDIGEIECIEPFFTWLSSLTIRIDLAFCGHRLMKNEAINLLIIL